MQINPDNIIKSRIAETIVELMLKNAGYLVYRSNFKWMLDSLKISNEYTYMRDQAEVFGVNKPTFLAIKNKIPYFIEVKYRKDGNLEKEELDTWLRGRIMLVFPFQPYFYISRISEFRETEKLHDLDKDETMQITKETINMFSPFIDKYLKDK